MVESKQTSNEAPLFPGTGIFNVFIKETEVKRITKETKDRANYPNMSLVEAQRLIDKLYFQRPVLIPGTKWAIRRFWRDGKEAPPLPNAPRRDWPLGDW